MRRILLAAMIGAGMTWSLLAHDAATPTPSTEKTGLIDMAYVFKHSKKFNSLRDELKEKITSTDKQAKQMAKIIAGLKADLKRTKSDSLEHSQIDRDIVKLTREFDEFKRDKQKSFLKEESELYRTVYLEVCETVEEVSRTNGFTVVIRTTRDDLATIQEPKDVIKQMNRQVVFFQPANDITEEVLARMNENFAE